MPSALWENLGYATTYIFCSQLLLSVCYADVWNGFNAAVAWLDRIRLVHGSCRYRQNIILHFQLLFTKDHQKSSQTHFTETSKKGTNAWTTKTSRQTQESKKKVAHTRLPSVGFRSWSRFLAVSLQVTWVINPAVGCHYFPPGQQLPSQPLTGLLPILLLGEQRHNGCGQFA